MEDNKKITPTEETVENINPTPDDTQTSVPDIKEEKQDKLDLLMLDSDESYVIEETPDEAAKYEAFFAEYRELIGESVLNKNDESDEGKKEEDELDFLISLPKKARKKKEKKTEASKSEWDEEITLSPEEYEDLSEADNVLKDNVPEEEIEPDFSLGDTKKEVEDDFQISINFSGEEQSTRVEEAEEYKYDPDKPRFIDSVFDFVELFVFVLVTVMILTTFFFKTSNVEGNSMLNTLENGDQLIISGLFYTPERGDIVVFEDYSTSLRHAVVKRVIGLPGETVDVKINSEGAYEVYINGELLDEPYAYNNIQYTAHGVGHWEIQEGEVFVMGDNRYNSLDSRYAEVGPVDIDSILGKVLFRFYPFDKFGAVE